MATIKYENATYRTHGDLPAIGSRAPDVSLVNTKLQNATLANWLGIRKVMNIILSVDTDICAKSVIEFDRRAAESRRRCCLDGVLRPAIRLQTLY